MPTDPQAIDLDVAATYSRSNFFVGSSGNVLRGGYLLVLLGSPAHGSGPTLEEALSDLVVDVTPGSRVAPPQRSR